MADSNHHPMSNDLFLYTCTYISVLFLLLLPNRSSTLIYGYYGIQSTWQKAKRTDR